MNGGRDEPHVNTLRSRLDACHFAELLTKYVVKTSPTMLLNYDMPLEKPLDMREL